jgi:hypothetical protein
MSKVYKLWSSDASRIDVGIVGDHDRAFARICITTRRSGFDVRISYRIKVRSDPTLARMERSLKLKRTEVTVSVDVGKVKLEIGDVLG